MTPERPSDPPEVSGWLPRGPFGFTDEGEGVALVALHGLPGTVRDFRWLAPALSPGVRLIRLEQAGFGGTPVATEPDPSLAARTELVIEMLDALSIDRFVVLGHSMGGPLAMSVAAAAPDRAIGLALLSSVGTRPHRLVRKVGRNPDLPRFLALPVIGRLLHPPLRKAYARAGFPKTTPIHSMIHCSSILAALRFDEIRAAVRAVRCPSFLAWAEDDPLVESTIALELGQALPPGPRIAYPDGGHNIQKSRAIEIASALSAWLLRGCAASAA